MKRMRTENDELKQSLAKVIKSLDKLTYEKQTATSQMEQQAM